MSKRIRQKLGRYHLRRKLSGKVLLSRLQALVAINRTIKKKPVQLQGNSFAITIFNRHVLSQYSRYRVVKKNFSCQTMDYLAINMPLKITNYSHLK
ncbi:hypothetical protein PCC6912_20070 [Chlorogloeopsis fritschii PCC 6912]|uniref:Uncharacterized protein n=1 Tax=Chlorogloeopsis fritschii PCC 6912 TaxID=211165 RepID=A0A3S1A233_CHLFR|nr:hypothetical protein [Chlorogloeopsis fritschii]RUR83764.1 hypothetical protein PCC6912_20070 [Chlorogloeopsis fritschii PCC 6912]